MKLKYWWCKLKYQFLYRANKKKCKCGRKNYLAETLAWIHSWACFDKEKVAVDWCLCGVGVSQLLEEHNTDKSWTKLNKHGK